MHHKIRELETKNASERALRDDVESEVLEKSKRIVDLGKSRLFCAHPRRIAGKESLPIGKFFKARIILDIC